MARTHLAPAPVLRWILDPISKNHLYRFKLPKWVRSDRDKDRAPGSRSSRHGTPPRSERPKPRADPRSPCRRPRRPSTPVSLERASVCTGTPSARTFASLPRQASSRHDARSAPARAGRASSTRPRPSRSTTRALASHRLLAQILASHLAGSERNPSARAEEAGRAWGAHLVRRPPPFTSISKEETIDEVVHLHEQFGFSPELREATEWAGARAQALSLPGAGDDLPGRYLFGPSRSHEGSAGGARDWRRSRSLEPFAEPGACVAHVTGV